MRVLHFCDQYTPEWWALRRGKPTASQFHRIVTPGGKPAKAETTRAYMCKLIAERLLGITIEDTRSPFTAWAEHGRVTEPLAIDAFASEYELILERVGFITTFDGRLGSSPDCLVKGSVQAVEIKCPAPHTQVNLLLYGPGTDYKPQVQGHLLVGEWDTVHLYTYHPRCPPFHLETHRDRDYLAAMKSLLDEFCDTLDEETERARSIGFWDWIGQTSPAEEVGWIARAT